MTGGCQSLTKLEVNLRKSIPQIKEPGRYTVKNVSDPRSTKFGSAVPITLLDATGNEWALFVPHSPEPSEESNLGRLVKAFGKDTALWLKKKIDIEIGADKRRTVKPVTK
jgi:hypothetical protein